MKSILHSILLAAFIFISLNSCDAQNKTNWGETKIQISEDYKIQCITNLKDSLIYIGGYVINGGRKDLEKCEPFLIYSLNKGITSNMPLGYELKWGGQFENFTRAKNRLMLVVPIALAIIFGMLILAFGNVYYAIGVFMVVPLAASGGIISLVLRGLPFSIPAGVGFIAVSGIAVLNGVVYASTLKDKLKEGIELSHAVRVAAIESLRPVMTTELIAAIGFIPMAISNMAGAEVQRPLATVVIGGVIIATILSRLLLPITMEYLLTKAEHMEERKQAEIDVTKTNLIALLDQGESE